MGRRRADLVYPEKPPTSVQAEGWVRALPLPGAHHRLFLAGCTYTGRIFYNNETFPSVLDPCLSCICLVCTTQTWPLCPQRPQVLDS